MAELVEKGGTDITVEDIKAKAAEVNSLISGKKFIPALLKALENPPVQSKTASVKEANRDVVFRAIESIPSGDKDIGMRLCPLTHVHVLIFA